MWVGCISIQPDASSCGSASHWTAPSHADRRLCRRFGYADLGRESTVYQGDPPLRVGITTCRRRRRSGADRRIAAPARTNRRDNAAISPDARSSMYRANRAGQGATRALAFALDLAACFSGSGDKHGLERANYADQITPEPLPNTAISARVGITTRPTMRGSHEVRSCHELRIAPTICARRVGDRPAVRGSSARGSARARAMT